MVLSNWGMAYSNVPTLNIKSIIPIKLIFFIKFLRITVKYFRFDFFRVVEFNFKQGTNTSSPEPRYKHLHSLSMRLYQWTLVVDVCTFLIIFFQYIDKASVHLLITDIRIGFHHESDIDTER